MDEVMFNKVASLEKCIRRVQEEYAACQGDIENEIFLCVLPRNVRYIVIYIS